MHRLTFVPEHPHTHWFTHPGVSAHAPALSSGSLPTCTGLHFIQESLHMHWLSHPGVFAHAVAHVCLCVCVCVCVCAYV